VYIHKHVLYTRYLFIPYPIVGECMRIELTRITLFSDPLLVAVHNAQHIDHVLVVEAT